MLPTLRLLFSLLTSQQRRRLWHLQCLVIVTAFAEVGSVLAIGPFMALVGDMSRLEGSGYLARLYALTGFEAPAEFLFWMGLSVLAILAAATAISMLTVWRLWIYSHQLGAELSVRLFRHYMKRPWLFHANGTSNALINNISQECKRVTDAIIAPLMQMNARVVMVAFMALMVFLFNPLVASAAILLFSGFYLLLYRTVRRRLQGNGKAISRTQQQRFQLLTEGFGGIKDVLVLGRQKVFNQRFEKASRRFGRAQGTNKALSAVPRYLMELVAFGSVIFLVLYLLAAHQGNLGTILPVLSVYALAGFKMLPAFQQIYAQISTVRGNLAAFENIRSDLSDSLDEVGSADESPQEAGRLVPRDTITLDNIRFQYPGKDDPALNGLSLIIPAYHSIGLVGPSGSGKSTTIDILLGLIEPQQGSLRVDGEAVDGIRRRAWMNSVGFVPQSIFLSDASIRENIAFGLPPEDVDEQRLRHAARLANLEALLEELPEGLDTRVGERGIQLSGGQRQRIGIARALYDDAKVLILDEATSALDGITEQMVMDAIHEFTGTKTIIMIAHRLATVRDCHCIYLLEQGRVVDHGRYDDLVARNATFQRMAKLS